MAITDNIPLADDTEGQMFLPDAGTSHHLANSRSSEINKQVRDKHNEKMLERNGKLLGRFSITRDR